MIDVTVLNAAKDTYLITDRVIDEFRNQIKLPRNWVMNYTDNTEVRRCSNKEREVYIIGLCVDSHGELSADEIPRFLLECNAPIEELFHVTARFAGKYVIVIFWGEKGYILGDAISSIPIYYGFTEDKVCIGNADGLVAKYLGSPVSIDSKAIRTTYEGKGSFYLPGDVSMYENIKVVLPNHFLSLEEKQVIRIPLYARIKNNGDPYSLISESLELIRHIVKEYKSHLDYVCPLTAGYDSRVSFSFLKDYEKSIRCFTFRHPGFTDNTPDLTIPSAICGACGQQYEIFNDELPSKEDIDSVIEIMGDYPPDSVITALQFRSVFPGKAWIESSIIDQIGKCSHVGTFPYFFANTSFFRRLHYNWGKEAGIEIENWFYEIKKSADYKYITQLWEWEIRCGRWATRAFSSFSLCGVDLFNLFNCRELILKWMSVPAKLRTEYFIHLEYIKALDSRLLNYPFNPREKTIRVLLASIRWPWFCRLFRLYAETFLRMMGSVVNK